MDKFGAWKKGVKSRLRDVAKASGTQRALAKAWLGSADKSPQVNAWCGGESGDSGGVPETYSLHRLREECGTDLNWLIGGPVAPADDDGDEWTAERRARLHEDLWQFAARLVWDRIESKRLPYTRLLGISPTPTAFHNVVHRFHGDFLKFFATEIEKVTDDACEDLLCAMNADDARLYRREHREAREAERQKARRDSKARERLSEALRRKPAKGARR